MQSCDLTALVVGKCVLAPRSQLAYTDTLGLSTRGKKEHVRLPKTHHNNPNHDK